MIWHIFVSSERDILNEECLRDTSKPYVCGVCTFHRHILYLLCNFWPAGWAHFQASYGSAKFELDYYCITLDISKIDKFKDNSGMKREICRGKYWNFYGAFQFVLFHQLLRYRMQRSAKNCSTFVDYQTVTINILVKSGETHAIEIQTHSWIKNNIHPISLPQWKKTGVFPPAINSGKLSWVKGSGQIRICDWDVPKHTHKMAQICLGWQPTYGAFVHTYAVEFVFGLMDVFFFSYLNGALRVSCGTNEGDRHFLFKYFCWHFFAYSFMNKWENDFFIRKWLDFLDGFWYVSSGFGYRRLQNIRSPYWLVCALHVRFLFTFTILHVHRIEKFKNDW